MSTPHARLHRGRLPAITPLAAAIAALLATTGGSAPALAQDTAGRLEFIPANPSHYSRGRRGKTPEFVVIHTIEGSLGSGINTFKYSSRKVSCHYLVGYDGRTVQMVDEANTAWHAGNSDYNRRSIGIEHEGYAGRNNWTDAQYRASAAITRSACDRYGIPKDRAHIIAHKDVPRATHWDPGNYFDWDYYIRLVRGVAGATPDLTRDTPPSEPTTPPTTSRPRTTTPRTPWVSATSPLEGQTVGRAQLSNPTGDPATGLTGLVLRWRNEGADHVAYRLVIDDDGDLSNGVVLDSGRVGSGNSAARLNVALRPGTSYTWSVRVLDAAGNVHQSKWQRFKTDFSPPRVIPITPHDGAEITHSPTLEWRVDDPDGAPASFRVQLDDDADHSKIKADTKELNGNPGSWSLRSRLKPGRTYWWRVGVFDGRGNIQRCEWQSFRTSEDYSNLDGLEVVALSPVGNTKTGPVPVFRFQYYNRLNHYQKTVRIFLDNDADHSHVPVQLDLESGATALSWNRGAPLDPNRTYYWKVRVGDGEKTAESAWSSFTVKDDHDADGLLERLVEEGLSSSR